MILRVYALNNMTDERELKAFLKNMIRSLGLLRWIRIISNNVIAYKRGFILRIFFQIGSNIFLSTFLTMPNNCCTFCYHRLGLQTYFFTQRSILTFKKSYTTSSFLINKNTDGLICLISH